MLETCASMTFPNSLRVILQICPWKPIYRMYGYYTTQGYLMCSKFWTLF